MSGKRHLLEKHCLSRLPQLQVLGSSALLGGDKRVESWANGSLTCRVGNDCAKLLAKAGRPSYSAGGRMTTLLALRVSANWTRLTSAVASCCAKVVLLAHDAKTVLSSCSTQHIYARLCFLC